MARSSFERSQHSPALGEPRTGIDLKDAQRGIGTSRRTRLADRLTEPRRPRLSRIVKQRPLITRRRPKALDGEPQQLGGRGDKRQPGSERQPHPRRIGKRLAEYDLLPPGPALLDKDRREDDRPKCPTTSLTPRQQTINQERKGAFELCARRRLRKLERLPEELRRRPGTELAVTTRRELMSEQSETTKPIRQGGWGDRRQFAQCLDTQPLERVRKVQQRRPGTQQSDRQWSEIGPRLGTRSIGIDADRAGTSHDLWSAHPRPRGSGDGRESRRRDPDPCRGS